MIDAFQGVIISRCNSTIGSDFNTGTALGPEFVTQSGIGRCGEAGTSLGMVICKHVSVKGIVNQVKSHQFF